MTGKTIVSDQLALNRVVIELILDELLDRKIIAPGRFR